MMHTRSITVPSDIRQSALDELERIWRITAVSPEKGVYCHTSTAAADRNFLLAIGLLERNGNVYSVTDEGEDLLDRYIAERNT